jgi:release factor glutamine methyltransferase
MTFDQLIEGSGLPRVEGRLLLAHLLGKDKTWLVGHGGDEASAEIYHQAETLFQQRRLGRPIAYLLGEREFYSRSFLVGPGVLIPRPETELLVDWALEVLQAKKHAHLYVLDLGCGSGCVGLTIALEARRLKLGVKQLTLTDLESQALSYSRDNAARLGVNALVEPKLQYLAGSWFQPVDPGLRYDLIVSNPPYIRADDEHLSQGDLRFEPPSALSSGASGLDALSHIIATAPLFLQPNGQLMLEHGFDQAESVQTLLFQHGFVDVKTRWDLAGHPRISAGMLP